MLVTATDGNGELATGIPGAEARSASACFHCGTACRGSSFESGEKRFCCHGCLTVYELLAENGLTDFYGIDAGAGVRVAVSDWPMRFAFLDEPAIRERMVDFTDGATTRVTFRLPAIHCMACIWLLEHLFQLRKGIGGTQVNFLRKEAMVTFDLGVIKLSEVAALLASLGYEPDFKLADLNGAEEAARRDGTPRKLWMQLGVAGFAFGNNMLFSIASYLGMDAFHGPAVQKLVGLLSMALAVPVLVYSAQDYFRQAWVGLKHKLLTIEAPIAAGILVIFAQSAYEVLSGTGEGYFDSFAGLLFFLLCGRLFQQKTYSRLAFDRDYQSFFPLAITRLNQGGAESVSLSLLRTGDRLLIRNGELIPADARLMTGHALIDYSFVTGEAEPVSKSAGDLLYAGGRQVGAAIEIETIKAVSQSYLTSLWNQEAFAKSTTAGLDTLINRYSERFTRIILLVACCAAGYWAIVDRSLAVKAFASVLIVACPCALALAAPFTMGTALRTLGRKNIFVKSADTVERLARITSIVFDKTGTLTGAGACAIDFAGRPLTQEEQAWVQATARQSSHPYAVRISNLFAQAESNCQARSFVELPGRGIEANVSGHEVVLGSAAWFESRGIATPARELPAGSVVELAIDGAHRGAFVLVSALRPEVASLPQQLAPYKLALLSGDNDKSQSYFETLFRGAAQLRFQQTPFDKLDFVRSQQEAGEKVMMVGDGLNDAGALKQSDVGVAVVEKIGTFSPASDVIIGAEMVAHLGALLRFSKGAVTIVHLSFFLSTVYNIVGLTIAARGELSPLVCAILMPLSSLSVVVFACLSTAWWGGRVGLVMKAGERS